MREGAAARLAALVTVLGCAVAEEGPTPSSEPPPSSAGNLGLAGVGGSESGGSGGTTGGTGGAGGSGGSKAGSGGSAGVNASGGSSGTGGATAGTGGSGGNAGTGGGSSGSGGKGGSAGSGGAMTTGGASGKGGSSGTGAGGAGAGGSSGKGGSGGSAAGSGGSAAGSGGSGGMGPPGGMVLLDEDFESGTDGWSILGQAASDWTLVNDGSMVFQAANAPGSNSFRAQRAGSTNWTDVRATARIKVTSLNGSQSDRFAGLCVRVRDDVTYYCLALRSDDKLAIRYRQGSGSSGMNSASVNFALELDTWYDAAIEVVGTTVTGNVGAAEVSVTGITTASGNVAIAVPGINARFDDVLVTTL